MLFSHEVAQVSKIKLMDGIAKRITSLIIYNCRHFKRRIEAVLELLKEQETIENQKHSFASYLKPVPFSLMNQGTKRNNMNLFL